MRKNDFVIISQAIGKKVTSEKDLTKKNITFDFVKRKGKVGFMKTKEDGTTQYVILDGQYLFEREYRTAVNRTGFRPVYLRKILLNKDKDEKTGEKIKRYCLDKEIKKVRQSVSLVKYARDNKDAYLKSLTLVKKQVPLRMDLVKKSIQRLSAEDAGKRRIDASVKEGIRQAILDQKASETVGKLCRLTTTSANEPDLEHALLEWKWMPCEEVFEHLSRFGCKHDFEVKES